jgi:hypothetical protein
VAGCESKTVQGQTHRNSTWTECYPSRTAYVSKFNDVIQTNAYILGEVKLSDSELEVPFDKNFQLDDSLQNCKDKLSQYLGQSITLLNKAIWILEKPDRNHRQRSKPYF